MFNEASLAMVAQEVVKVVHYCHGKGMLHGDIKPAKCVGVGVGVCICYPVATEVPVCVCVCVCESKDDCITAAAKSRVTCMSQKHLYTIPLSTTSLV